MSKLIQKPIKCRKAKCGASCDFMTLDIWGNKPDKCLYYQYAPYLYEKKETFENMEIFVKAKINRLCNENKHDEAVRLEKALNIIMEQDYNH